MPDAIMWINGRLTPWSAVYSTSEPLFPSGVVSQVWLFQLGFTPD